MSEPTINPNRKMTPLEIIAALDAAAQLANMALGWVNSINKPVAEWTPEERAAFREKLRQLRIDPPDHWKIEP